MGGCLALHALRKRFILSKKLRGLFSIGSFLVQQSSVFVVTDDTKPLEEGQQASLLPVFMMHGKEDSLVRHSWGHETAVSLLSANNNAGCSLLASVRFQSYEHVDHQMSADELSDLVLWMLDEVERVDERIKGGLQVARPFGMEAKLLLLKRKEGIGEQTAGGTLSLLRVAEEWRKFFKHHPIAFRCEEDEGDTSFYHQQHHQRRSRNPPTPPPLRKSLFEIFFGRGGGGGRKSTAAEGPASQEVPSFSDFEALVRKGEGGFSEAHRADLWYACSGAGRLRQVASKSTERDGGGSYAALLLAEINQLQAEKIEKDLKRTMAGLEESDICALRNVLRAFCARNPDTGYVQSLNFLACFILLHVATEERAFWVFAALVENILPQYYRSAAVETAIDQRLIMRCIKNHHPQHLLAYFESAPLAKDNLNSITFPWLMCCFINVLPYHVVAKVLDMVFLEGSHAILRMALAMIRSKEGQLSSPDSRGDDMAIFEALKSGPSSSQSFKLNDNDIDGTALLREAYFDQAAVIAAIPSDFFITKRSEYRHQGALK